MATFTSQATGNFADGATWVGGVAPGPGDLAVAATGHTVTIAADRTISGLQNTGGKFVLPAGVTLTNNGQILGGTGVTTLECTALSGTTTILGTGSIAAGTTNTTRAVLISGANIVNITQAGGLTGGSSTARVCIDVAAAATVSFVGPIAGGSSTATAINLSAGASSLSVTGNITGSSAAVILMAAASQAVTVTGNIAGGLGSTSTTSAISMNANTQTVTITGAITNVSSGVVLYINSVGGVATINGNITCSSGWSVYCSSQPFTLTVNGNITLTGSGASTSGVVISADNASTTVTINGDMTAFTGGTSYGGTCINTGSSSTFRLCTVVVNGSQIDAADGTPCLYGLGRIKYVAKAGVVDQHANNAGGAMVTRSSSDVIASGNPAPANVRLGTTYGGGFTGTLAVPTAAQVAYGIPVDNTIGTATLGYTELVAVLAAQIAAASTSPAV